ncbi:MAG: hypothetical protein JWQ87_2573 [Candidatus Sulfotelmatobacter sp.]|nr:hypothetical protein [Candidatus Sulfotelmatobacter sp.]
MPIPRFHVGRFWLSRALAAGLMFLSVQILPCAFAQTELATVLGRVTDPSGAVVTGAEVEIRNVDTNLAAISATNPDGLYTIPSLHPGHYVISVRKPGFKTVSVTQVDLNVQDNVVRNFILQVGSSSESITVTAEGERINTTDATVSTVVDRNFAENLPMNGRSFQTLIQLTPGVVLTANSSSDNGQFSVNGQRAAANYWMVDGVGANIGIGASPKNGLGGAVGSFSVLGGTNSLVSVDAMQEFRIQTSTYAPEFGRMPGGQISIVTRSGTNQLHGTAFDYLRNDILDANGWFNGYTNKPPLPKPEERQNDFGGTLSGPILKNRTFFFFSYEGLRLRLPQTQLTTVPDASFTPDGTTNSRQNAIPALQPYFNAYPLPNATSPEILEPCDPSTDPTCPASGQKATGSAAYNASFSNSATLDASSLRIDHKLNDKFTLFGRYNYSPSKLIQRGGSGNALSIVNPTRITTQTATAGATWLIWPAVAADLRFNYSQTSASSSSHFDNFGGAVPLTSSPFPSPFTFGDSLFSMSVESLTNGGFNAGNQGRNRQRQFNVVENLSVQKGLHNIKVGVDFRRLTPMTNPDVYSQGLAFNDIPSAEAGSVGFGLLESKVNSTFLLRNLGLYAQDTWRASSHLSVTYGLRWDVDFAPRSLNGPNIPAVTGFDLNNLAGITLAPAGTSPFHTPYGNVAPRVGLAYQFNPDKNWQTVLRGGFGLFYDLATSEIGNQISVLGYPFGAFGFVVGVPFPLDATTAAPPTIAPPTASNGGLLTAFNPNLQLPYTFEWNVAVEQTLGADQTISASYVGAAGKRLLQTTNVFPGQPNQVGLFLVTNAGTSDYDALQVQFRRRLSHALQALASYTWAHSIDTASAGSVGVDGNALVPSAIANGNRGPSDFDVRNAFSAGVTYDLPTPKVNAFTAAILRGWSIQNVIQASSAPPVNITDGNFSQFSDGAFAGIRPDVVPGQPFYVQGAQCTATFGSRCPGGKGFNPAAFTDPPFDPNTFIPLRQGNVPRNFLRGFGATQWDLAIHRDFPIRESIRLQFRAEMFNVMNHPNFGPPKADISSGGFGLSRQMLGQSLTASTGSSNLGGGALSPLYQLGGPRSVQVALKLSF